MSHDWNTLVAQHPPLAILPAGLRDAAWVRPFTRGEILFRQGDTPQAMAYVVAGEVRLLRRSPSGAELILQRSRGGFIAEASLDAPVYHYDIVGADDGRLLMLPRNACQSALERDPDFNRAWIRLLAAEVRRLRARCERLSLNTAAERVLHYLETEGVDGVVLLGQTRKAWAAELGLSHEALYRVLRKLQQTGDVQIDGARIALSAAPFG